MALLSAVHSRAILTCLVVLFSAIAVIITVADAAGLKTVFGHPGDYHPLVIVPTASGAVATGVLAVLERLVPTRKRLWDRLMFDVACLLGWMWSSFTMAFSGLYIILAYSDTTYGYWFWLPSCDRLMPTLICTLVLLHLLSLTNAALALVVMAEACFQDDRTAFPLWQMALAPLAESTYESLYGAADATAIRIEADETQDPNETAETSTVAAAQRKRDKFDDGRLKWYISLLFFSICAVVSAGVLAGKAPSPGASPFAIVTGSLSLMFALYFIASHRKQKSPALHKLEVGTATALLILWPCCAITLALYPGSLGHPCRKEEPIKWGLEDMGTTGWKEQYGFDFTEPVTYAVLTIVSVWFAAWSLFFRLFGLVFPMPDVVNIPREMPPGPEGESLLGRGGNPRRESQDGVDSASGM